MCRRWGLGVLPGVLGTLQANEAIKILLGIGDTASGRLIMYDALDLSFRELKVSKSAECPVCSSNPSITELIDYEQFCGLKNEKDVNMSIKETTVEQLNELMKTNHPFKLIDVRESFERDICRIEGAELIPLNTLPESLDKINPNDHYSAL